MKMMKTKKRRDPRKKNPKRKKRTKLPLPLFLNKS